MKTVEWILDHCVADDELRQKAYAEFEFFKKQAQDLEYSLTKENERLATKIAKLEAEKKSDKDLDSAVKASRRRHDTSIND